MKLLEIRVVEQVIATNFAAIAMVGVVIGRSENLMKNKIQHQRKISLLDNDRVVKTDLADISTMFFLIESPFLCVPVDVYTCFIAF